ncbi:hypothetical protein MY8738_008519 [Beauveria namnaoensis]
MFLASRLVNVRFKDAIAEALEILCGIPQGSPLSPILYLLATAALYKLPGTTQRYGYADDTAMLFVRETLNETTRFHSLLDLTVHFIDDGGKLRTFLLGLPRIEGQYSGENLADRVSGIIHEYNLNGRVGYFIANNAESNDTCLDELAGELGFKKQHRRLRCCRHIINLVARSVLFGTDVDAFEEDRQVDKEFQEEVNLWRAKGPIGKLHNIVHCVQRSGQRIKKLHRLQSIENAALGLDDHTTYDVITDNATRWYSSEAMRERGYQLRNPLDSPVQAEVTEWGQYVAARTANGMRPMPKRSRKKPAFVNNKMTSEDWAVIAEYLTILKPLKIATKRLEGRLEEGQAWGGLGSPADNGKASEASGGV